MLQWREEQLRNDPPLSSPLPAVGSGTAVRRACRTPGARLLVYIGGCQGCLSVDLQAWARSASTHHVKLVLLLPGDTAAAANLRRRAGIPGAEIVLDPDGAFGRRMNAFMSPRAYLFAPDWRLIWIQREIGQGTYDPLQTPEVQAALKEMG